MAEPNPNNELFESIESFLKEKRSPEEREKAGLKMEMLELCEAIKERLEYDPEKVIRGSADGDLSESRRAAQGETVTVTVFSGGKRARSYTDIFYKDDRTPISISYDARIQPDGGFLIKVTKKAKGTTGPTEHHRIAMGVPDSITPDTPEIVKRFRGEITRLYLNPQTTSRK